MDEKFDCNDDYIDDFELISSDRMAIVLFSGKVIVREMKTVSDDTCSSIVKLTIPCPEDLKRDTDDTPRDGTSLHLSRYGVLSLLDRKPWLLYPFKDILKNCSQTHFILFLPFDC